MVQWRWWRVLALSIEATGTPLKRDKVLKREREREVEMEEDMEIEVFEAHEVDLDYEFDAARFFDFTRAESGTEARGAELWFESAKTYPPSPFVAKMVLGEDVLKENVNISPKSNIVEKTTSLLNNGPDVGAGLGSLSSNINKDCIGKGGGVFTNLWSGKLQKNHNQAQHLMTGLTNHMTDNDNLNINNKPDVKKFFPRSSTLMKPTASQLAKQNRSHQSSASRLQTSFGQSNQKSSCNSSVVESQAAKRQKLDGGHLRKLADVKQQINLVHKVPRKDGPFDGNLTHARLKLTIPREPDLETTQRAQRARPNNNTEVEEVRAATRRFKARPLNRKILEAPSLPLPKKSIPRLPEFQVFHLKTSERAMQHKSVPVPSSSLNWNESERGLGLDKASTVAENVNRRTSTTDALKQDASEKMHNFKARPLNKKILSSKGDIGVFRNIKRETTVPMEFNFHSQKKIQHNPPVDLFSKLSLTSGLQPNKESQLKLPQSSCIKGPKENRFQSFQQEHNKTAHLVKEKCSMIGGKQIHYGGDTTEVGAHLSTRNLGIR